MLIRTLKSVYHEPVRAIVLGFAGLVLAAAIAYPLYLVFKFSLYTPQDGLSLKNFVIIFEQRGILAAVWNSTLLAVLVPIGCLLIGIPFAYLVSRTDLPGKAIIRTCAAAAFVIPSFITVIGWVFLAAPNSGQLNKFARAFLDADGPLINIYSFSGLIFVEVAHLFPIAFFAISASLDNMDASYEQAARILGAGRARTAATVTVPLVGPAIVSAAMLCSIDALAAFGAPAALGLPGNFSVLTLKIYQLISEPPRLELAAALSIPIICFTLFCLYLQRLYLRRSRFVTVGGKATPVKAIELGVWRWPIFAICIIVCTATVILPVLALIALSFLRTFGARLSLSNMTTDNYTILFDPSLPILASFQNSFLLAIGTACCCAALALLYVWIVERTTLPGRGVVTGIIMVVYGLPPVALGVGIILGYINLLYGTLAILLLGYIAKHLPLSFVMIRNAVKQVTPELEEVSRICGATWLRSIKDITVPLLKPAILMAWILVFALSLRELPLSVMLVQPGTEVMAVSVLNLIGSSFLESAAAVSILIVAVSVVSMFIARIVAGRGVLEVR